MKEKDLRESLVTRCRDLEKFGLNQGTAGNLSIRLGDTMLITPSAVPYDQLTPEMIASMPLDGEYGSWTGPLPPSSEWRIHLDILKGRPDVGALIHTHSLYATTLSMLRKPIPAAHYMIAAFGGPTIRCTDYAPFGTKELSDFALAGLEGRMGVLLGSHGMVVLGATLDEAMWRAVELETLAKMFYLAASIGKPAILDDEEIARIVERFKTYGYKPPKERETKAEKKRASKKAQAV
ncbi:class II aldolase/adducin family protein [Methyloferula stellata]|uniref:class II aldolase/adducin family protein n=1 Tax=Methyloferula stellata TaxID=876270 RepID=UPI000373BE1E